MTETPGTGVENKNWDQAVDLLVVGSGAGAMTAALAEYLATVQLPPLPTATSDG